MAAAKQITLTHEGSAEPLMVSGDRERINQVLTNLVTNAINYTKQGGSIIVRLYREHNRAVVEVEDSGIGIAPGALETIFEPFYRADEESGTGTGLGLAIAREIIHLHEGDLTVSSELGKGSIFRFWLPLANEMR